MKRILPTGALLAASILAGCASHPGHDAAGPAHHAAKSGTEDRREPVAIPEPLRTHMLANMRDHLVALGEIQQALALGDFDRAADVAERRLGMSSLQAHGAHDVAAFMPRAMQEAGTAMHRSASRFATVAKDASITGELRAPLSALAQVNQACVTCHAGFRVK